MDCGDRGGKRRVLLGLLFGLLALVYAPLIIAAIANPRDYAGTVAYLLATAAALGSLAFGIARLTAWMRECGLGVTDRIAAFTALITAANAVAGRCAFSLLLGNNLQILAFPIWLSWFLGALAFPLCGILVIWLMVTTCTKWGDSPPIRRATRAGILIGLVASVWLMHVAGLPAEQINVMIPP
jgi:hypothetical protein